jgi:predicted metal-dependent TIM-barrel fold hydrolase
MKSYILFIYGAFEDHEDLEFFCLEHFTQVSESGVKYVIESLGNCIIIFDSDKDKETLIEDLKKLLDLEHIRFYFIFEKENVFWAEIPEALREFIFKPQNSSHDAFKVSIRKLNKKFDLDDILEKIQDQGMDSLTEDEKKFLDEFGK